MRWAPSAFNEQPWRLIYALRQDEADFKRLLDLLVPYNQLWAENAAMLVLALTTEFFEKNGKPNHTAKYDLGLGIGNLIHQALAEGLQVHQAAGYDAEKARDVFGLPEGIQSVCLMAIGKPAPLEEVHEDLKDRAKAPRERKPIEDFAFQGQFPS